MLDFIAACLVAFARLGIAAAPPQPPAPPTLPAPLDPLIVRWLALEPGPCGARILPLGNDRKQLVRAYELSRLRGHVEAENRKD